MRCVKIMVVVAALTVVSTRVDARIKITFADSNDLFSFHAQIYDENYRAQTQAADLRIEAWNANGKIYSVSIPAGTCTAPSAAGSCVYENSLARRTRSGLAYFRVLYQAATHGNKIWLESYGDLSAATDPVMSIRIYLDDVLYAYIPNERFTQTHDGWVGF